MKAACERAFVLGLDGLRGPAVAEADTPNLDRVLAEGAWTLHAKTVLPSSSYPAWGSMLHGVAPEKHRLNSENTARDDSAWPSFLRVAREAHADWTLAAFSGWPPINTDLIEQSCQCVFQAGPDVELTSAAAEFIRAHRPRLFFLQLDDIDAVGHRDGYRSDEYLAKITETDGLVGLIFEAIRDSGAFDRSLIVVLSDHGGCEIIQDGKTWQSHGTDHPDCVDILWACRGPGVAQGVELAAEVNIMDTATVVAHALGLPVPSAWDAQVPDGIFV